MKINKRKVSLHDIIYLHVGKFTDWEIQIVGDEHSLAVPRTLGRTFSRLLGITTTDFNRYHGDRLIDMFERRAYSLPDGMSIEIINNGSEVLGIRKCVESKAVKDKKVKVRHKYIRFPWLYYNRFNLGFLFVAIYFTLYILFAPR